MQVTIHKAKTQLSKLIEAANAGEEVIISRGKVPVARLVAYEATRFSLGILREHAVQPAPDFFEPMDDDMLELWEGRA